MFGMKRLVPLDVSFQPSAISLVVFWLKAAGWQLGRRDRHGVV